MALADPTPLPGRTAPNCSSLSEPDMTKTIELGDLTFNVQDEGPRTALPSCCCTASRTRTPCGATRYRLWSTPAIT